MMIDDNNAMGHIGAVVQATTRQQEGQWQKIWIGPPVEKQPSKNSVPF